MPITITSIVARDIRFPTSRSFAGSDAMNPDPDYSAAYVILYTDSPQGLTGHGLTFTIGRGTELCVAAIDPVVMRNGRYLPPAAPGYSITMRPESLAAYAFPGGRAWTTDAVMSLHR